MWNTGTFIIDARNTKQPEKTAKIITSHAAIPGVLFFNPRDCTTERFHRRKNNFLRFLGFVLFYLSDSALIIHYVGFAIPIAEKLILSTYFMAQYLILWGTSLSYNSQQVHSQWSSQSTVK
ncbi:unnamed protein product [Gongylonema pulchrum]|uniref:lysoplasmalogenase n=1 Tax=Gongylonema pulchrum TaxID=637853 RepID=A0A183CV82_9BILA|nr:unnamed protein product [Gongylonema pulchrum]